MKRFQTSPLIHIRRIQIIENLIYVVTLLSALMHKIFAAHSNQNTNPSGYYLFFSFCLMIVTLFALKIFKYTLYLRHLDTSEIQSYLRARRRPVPILTFRKRGFVLFLKFTLLIFCSYLSLLLFGFYSSGTHDFAPPELVVIFFLTFLTVIIMLAVLLKLNTEIAVKLADAQKPSSNVMN